MYLDFSSVEGFHIELSSKCNAACPMCARNILGGATQPGLKLTEWQTEWLPQIFDRRLTGLKHILVCGCFGDPATASNALDVVRFIKSHTSAKVEFVSNASVRSEDWWFELGRILSEAPSAASQSGEFSDLGVFSVDGLEDTNHLYRRHTNFKKIIRNAKAFISAGGLARWDFIVFRHNEHQVEEAKRLAADLGFKQFRVRKTSRFFQSPEGSGRFPVKNGAGELEYYLEPPLQAQYYNQEIKKFDVLNATKESAEKYYNETAIDCLYKNKFRRFYVSAEGLAFPCSYLGNDYAGFTTALYRDIKKKMLLKYEPDFNSVPLHGWDKIMNHPFFKNDLTQSWQDSTAGGRFYRCARTCGAGFSPISSQSSTTEI